LTSIAEGIYFITALFSESITCQLIQIHSWTISLHTGSKLLSPAHASVCATAAVCAISGPVDLFCRVTSIWFFKKPTVRPWDSGLFLFMQCALLFSRLDGDPKHTLKRLSKF